MTAPPGPGPEPGYWQQPGRGRESPQPWAHPGGQRESARPGPDFYPPEGRWPVTPRPAPVRPWPTAPATVSPPPPGTTVPGPRRSRRVLVWSLVAVLFAVCGVLTVLAIALETGLTGLVIGFVLAVVPVVPVVAAFLWLDRHEAEPPSLLLFAFGWGAAVATLIAIVLNTTSTLLLQHSGGSPEVAMFTVAPIVEETSKGLAVLGVLLLARREFDGVVDGIVYAGMAGVGFAFIENVLYFGRSFVEAGGGGVVAVFVVRGIFSPFAHPLFTMAIGIGIGLAVRTRRPWVRVVAPLCGWLVAVLLHAAWNGSTLLGLQGFVGGYVFLQIPVFVGAMTLAVLARGREARLIARHLTTYAASGWLTPAEASMLSSLGERGMARRWAASTSGEPGLRAMREFQELASEAAFLRERMTNGTAPPDAAETERRILLSMWRLRPVFASPPRSALHL